MHIGAVSLDTQRTAPICIHLYNHAALNFEFVALLLMAKSQGTFSLVKKPLVLTMLLRGLVATCSHVPNLDFNETKSFLNGLNQNQKADPLLGTAY